MAYAEKRGKYWRARYKKPDGTYGSKARRPGGTPFRNKSAALDYGEELEADQRRGRFVDPRGGQTPFGTWAQQWINAQDLASSTMSGYRRRLTNHILPRWGRVALTDITPLTIGEWEADLIKGGLARSTAAGIRGLLGTMLEDAIAEGLLSDTANPARRQRRRGKWTAVPREEEEWVKPEQAHAIAANMRIIAGEWAYVLVLLAAYSGMRWGELVGLKRQYVLFEGRTVRVQWQLAELDDGTWEEKPPKYGSRRTLALPKSVAALLWAFVQSLPEGQEHVFLSHVGTHPRRFTFTDTWWHPAVRGRDATRKGSRLICPKLEPAGPYDLNPHGLRHGHKVAVDEDGATRIAAAERMGHKLKGVDATYSHVSKQMQERIVAGLQARFEAAEAALRQGGETGVVKRISQNSPAEAL